MAKVPTTLSIDADVKAKVQALYAELGLDLSTAVNMFFRQCLYENGIPCEEALPRASRRGKAAVEMADDEKIDRAAQRILKEHKAAFEELAK